MVSYDHFLLFNPTHIHNLFQSHWRKWANHLTRQLTSIRVIIVTPSKINYCSSGKARETAVALADSQNWSSYRVRYERDHGFELRLEVLRTGEPQGWALTFWIFDATERNSSGKMYDVLGIRVVQAAHEI